MRKRPWGIDRASENPKTRANPLLPESIQQVISVRPKLDRLPDVLASLPCTSSAPQHPLQRCDAFLQCESALRRIDYSGQSRMCAMTDKDCLEELQSNL